MRSRYGSKIALVLCTAVRLAGAQEVKHHPDTSQSLQPRWAWAESQAAQARFTKGYWIGYSIRRMMDENSTIGNVSFRNGKVYRGPGKSLSELIYGREMPLESSFTSATKPSRQVEKEVGIFYGFTSGKELTKIHESTFSLSVDFKDLPLL